MERLFHALSTLLGVDFCIKQSFWINPSRVKFKNTLAMEPFIEKYFYTENPADYIIWQTIYMFY